MVVVPKAISFETIEKKGSFELLRSYSRFLFPFWAQPKAGVTRARARFRRPGAAGNVYLAAEVNLVREALEGGAPTVINRVPWPGVSFRSGPENGTLYRGFRFRSSKPYDFRGALYLVGGGP